MTDQHLPQVVLAPEPFTPRAEVLEVPALGQKVSDLVAAAIRQGKLKDDADTIRRLRVHVNGVPLPADTKEQRLAAMRYVPRGGEIVNLVVVVQGGGGGGGNKVLQTVLTLAVVALSIWTGGAAGPLASSAAWVRAAASAAVAVGGQMAIGAIFSPNEERVRESNDPGALQDGSNSYRPRAPMPLCLGFRRWGFDLAAPPYTQVIGNDVYLNIALAPHYGRCWVGNLKVGETRLQDLPANEWAVEYFLEPGVPRRSNLYPKSTVQENYQDKLDFAGGGAWEVHTLQGGADRASVDITNPQGLYFNADSGKKRNEEYAGQIQFAEVGTENWQAATFPGYNTARDKNNRPLPAGSFYLNLRSFDPIRRTYEWALPDQTKQYKVRVRAWDPEGDDPSDTSRVWATYWTALRSIRNDPPIIDQNLSVIFLRIKTSDDLNGNLPLVTGECEPIVPVYQNGNWDTEARTSNGAALLRWLLTGPAAARPMIPAEFHSSCETTYQLIEANPTWKGALLVTDEKSQQDVMVGLGNMGRFSTFWNGSRLCFVPDWVRETPRQVFSGRNASGYRYRRTFPEPIHAVFVEFLNIDGGTVDDEMYVYADGYNAANTTLIETLKIDFACSPERAFQEGRVYLAKRLLQVEMHEWSAGAEAIATTYGDRVLVRHQATLYGLADGRVVNRFFQGALVSGFRFDEEVEMEAGKTYGIDVRRADGVIRSIPVVTEPGRTNVLKFAAPREVNLSPSKGDLVIFGETDVISEDLEIVDVEPQDDMTVTFRGIPYIADAIAGAINNPIPPLPSVISERVPAPRPIVPRPESVEPEGLVVQASAGPWNGPPVASFMARYRVITEDVEEGTVVGEWQVLDPVPASNGIIRTPAITGAAHPPADGQQVVIDLEVRTVLRSGETSLPTQISAIPVVANIPTPAAFSALGVTRTSASDGSSFGAISIQAAAILTGDIQTLEVEVQPAGGGAWVTPTGGLISARNPQGDVTGLNSGAPGYKVRARWIRSDNWPGPWVQEQNAVIPGGSNVSSDTANVGGVPSGSVAQFYVFERPAILDDLAEARATLYTATSGLVDQTAALFSQLNTPTTGVLARLTTVETKQTTDNSAAVGRLNALEATVNTPETGVVARLATAENAIATNNSAAVGRLQALEASVNTPMTGLLARMATQEAATVSLQTGKADATRVTLLEVRSYSLPNLIEDGDFSQEPLGVNWYREGGPNSTILYDNQVGNYLRITDNHYVVSKEYPVQVGGRLSVSWDGDSVNTAASVYLQALPSYALLGRASNSPALNNWQLRKFSDPALSQPVPEGTTAFRVVIDPQNAPIAVSRIKVNLGDQATFWSDERTTRSIGGSISTLETVTTDLQNNKASAQRVSLLEAGTDDVYFTRNVGFNLYTNAATTGFTTPDYWYPWGEKVNDSHREPGRMGPYCWWSHNNLGPIGGGDVGISQDYNNNPRLAGMAAGYYVLEADVVMDAGQIGGAGIFAYFAGGGSGSDCRINFITDPTVDGEVVGYNGVTGRLYSWRKLVKLENVAAGNMVFHLMTEWDGFEGNARPKVLRWQRAGIRKATAQEIAAERADVNAGSALSRVQTVESTTAELVARGGGGGNLIGNAGLLSLVGWRLVPQNLVEGGLDRPNTGINFPSRDWAPDGDNVLATHVNGITPGWYADWVSDDVTVEQLKTYEFGVRCGQHRTTSECYIGYTNGTDTGYVFAQLTDGRGRYADETYSGGRNIGGYGYFWGKVTIPAGFNRAFLILRRGQTVAGQADSWSWFTRPFIREIPADQTKPTPWDSGSQVWSLRAAWQVGVSIPGAEAFISAVATNNGGQRPTSSVAIGASIFAVYNQIGENWVKALEVQNGNAIFTGGLQAGAYIRLGSGQGWPVALRPVDFNLADGEVCSFGTDLGNIPDLTFQSNNLAPLNAGETYNVYADGLTATGFTMRAKINVPGVPSNQSHNDNKDPVSLGGFPGIQMFLAGKPLAPDGYYVASVYGTQSHRIIPSGGGASQADNEDYAYIPLSVWTYNGSWTKQTTVTVTSICDPDDYPSDGGQFRPQTVTNYWSDQVGFTLGGSFTHIAVVRETPTQGLSQGALQGLGPVSWQAAGSASGTRSATPNGQKTRVTVRPK